MTLNGRSELSRLLPAVMAEPVETKVLIVDSSSTDGTIELVEGFPEVELFVINRKEFNHGLTRELARQRLGTDIIVFLTQDVLPAGGWLKSLVAPIQQGKAVAAYARQLPHTGAKRLEAFPREFNYPPISHVRTLADVHKFGVYTFFCSDSCSAYLNTALDKIGGFEAILTNEDYFAAARLIRAGGGIAYVADSVVRHSHRYCLADEFRRYFDTGYVRAEHPWVTDLVGHAENRGSKFAVILLKDLLSKAPWLFPYAVLQLAAKWLGYRTGYLSYRWPRKWCQRLSSQRYYWTSAYCRHPKN